MTAETAAQATLLAKYTEACNYPGVLDGAAVEASLREYCAALKVERQVVRIMPGWQLSDYPSLERYVWAVAEKLPKKPALDALAARDARDGNFLTSIQRFAQWCVQSNGWWWGRFDLSWLATTHVGASQIHKDLPWAARLFDAYLAGCWFVHWTDDTLYWVAKPTVHVDLSGSRRRLHNATGPAVESDAENLYFINGVMVPAFVVVRPDWITIKHIETEDNAEVRRVMTERYGYARYINDSGAECVHELPDNYFVRGLQGAKLYRKRRKNDTDVVMIAVNNSTPEPDGSIRNYMLRVDPGAYGGLAAKDCHAAMASTWRNKDNSLYFANPLDYRPAVES